MVSCNIPQILTFYQGTCWDVQEVAQSLVAAAPRLIEAPGFSPNRRDESRRSGQNGRATLFNPLLRRSEVNVAIALIAILCLVGADGPLLAIADRPQFVAGNAKGHQSILGFRTAAISQPEVVFGGAALVAITLHHYREIGMSRKDLL